MQTRILAIGTAGALVLAGALTAATLVGGSDGAGISPLTGRNLFGLMMHQHDGHAGADEAVLHGGHAGDPHAQTGMARPAFAPAQGRVPSSQDAARLEEVRSIAIFEDADFTPAAGVRSGSGTLADPYVISGYHVTGDLYIADTDKCVVIRENYVGGQLTLNWNGQCVHVHHNHIRDLRVNENVRRKGYATGGLIESNAITVVGQIRHYDGEFRNNVVGPFTPADLWDKVLETTPLLAPRHLVANVDGFNEAWFHHNTFHGSVDLDLHGHHHGTGFFAPHSHYHGGDAKRMPDHREDHTDRWTSVAFTDNLILDPTGYGLRYEDENHAGDDRTAASESTDELEHDHRHHTLVTVSGNEVRGAQLRIDIFNADDRRHHTRNPGWLRIEDNKVVLEERQEPLELPFLGFAPRMTAAIQVSVVKELELTVARNTLEYVDKPDQPNPVRDAAGFLYWQEEEPAAIELWAVRDANITVEGNTAKGFPYGVRAREMDAGTRWVVQGNDFGDALYPVWYDRSVANPPVTDEQATGGDEGHQHGRRRALTASALAAQP